MLSDAQLNKIMFSRTPLSIISLRFKLTLSLELILLCGATHTYIRSLLLVYNQITHEAQWKVGLAKLVYYVNVFKPSFNDVIYYNNYYYTCNYKT